MKFFGMNQCNFIGRAAKVEFQFSTAGKPYTKFSLAVPQYKNGQQGVLWINGICFEKEAEQMEKNVNVGDLIFVSGELDIFQGKEKSSVSLIANTISKLSTKEESLKNQRKSQQEIDEDFLDESEAEQALKRLIESKVTPVLS